MKRLKIALSSAAAVASVIGAFAFNSHSNRQSFEYGITGTTGSGSSAAYTVEPFAATGTCNPASSSTNCSFEFPISGEHSILESDARITSLVTSASYNANDN
jgi:hypothetical protein